MEETRATIPPPPVVVVSPVDSLKGGIAKNYGGLIGAGGILYAFVETFRSDPKSSANLLAQFGPKYILWAGIAYMVYDLLKRALKPLNKGADNIGLMARNVGELAISVNTLVGKEDRTNEEMRRLCSFSAQQSERAVELAKEGNEVSKRTHEVLLRLEGRLSTAAAPAEGATQ